MWKNDLSAPTKPLKEDVHIGDPEPPDAQSFIRAHLGAQHILESLVGEDGVSAPAPTAALSTAEVGIDAIGHRMMTELDALGRRERQVREVRELATQRVIDLTAEQLRHILEFMV